MVDASGDPKDVPFPGATIIRCEVGSTLHGIAQGGTDDRDEIALCLEPYERAFGLHHVFEDDSYRTAAVREGRHDAPSQPGDLDLSVFSLRKWVRLALQGNPNVLIPLFAPQSALVHCDARGTHLRELAHLFASKQAGARFLGYLQAQRQRANGERGGSHGIRLKLIEAHNFDVKAASHVLRLGYQGVEFMETGRITFPLVPIQRERCLAVRRGEVSLNDVLTEAGYLEKQLRDLQDTSPLPEKPAEAEVQDWMLTTYWSHWKASYEHPRTLRALKAFSDHLDAKKKDGPVMEPPFPPMPKF